MQAFGATKQVILFKLRVNFLEPNSISDVAGPLMGH